MLNDVINYLDLEVTNFCSKYPNYNIYRVGSTLFSNFIQTNDIDYLVIDSYSKIDYTRGIENLKAKFSTLNVQNRAIETFDNKLNDLFSSIQPFVLENFHIEIVHKFGLGPIKLDNNKLSIHLAGPMNIHSANYFFRKFPMFYMGFSKYNKKLGIINFSDLLSNQIHNKQSLKYAIDELLIRAKNSNSILEKRKCLQRIKLIEFTYYNKDSPYIESTNFVTHKSDIEVNSELKKLTQTGSKNASFSDLESL